MAGSVLRNGFALIRRLASIAAAGLVLTSVGAGAQAATYSFTFTAPGDVLLASGRLFTSDTLNVLGGYDVLGASGIIDGLAIDELVDNPNAPAPAFLATPTVPGFGYQYDNVLFVGTTPQLDISGLLFRVGARLYNIYSGPGDALLYDTGGAFVERSGVFEALLVAEPSSWALMIFGAGMTGAVLRRQRKLAPA
jgi:hypothetical protein